MNQQRLLFGPLPTLLEDAAFHRFSEFTSFSSAELTRIRELARPPVRYHRHDVIRREGSAPEHLYVLVEGWVASSTVLANGRRLIFKIHLPGDLLGAASISMASAVDTLSALTSAVVARIPIDDFGEAFMTWPRFAGAMFLSAQLERVALMDRLTAVGRTPALARFSAMLLDLRDRLGGEETDKAHLLELCATQEDIADYLGLTTVHVNRVYRQLIEAGVISRTRQHIVIKDLGRLEALAMRPKRIPTARLALAGGS